MTFRRKLLLLFAPSWLSIVCGVIVSIIFTGVASFVIAQHNGLFGRFTPWTYVQGESLVSSLSLFRSLLNDVRLTSVFFIIFWVLIGFIAYNVIFALKGSVDESVGFIMQLRYVNAKPKLMGVQAIVRSIFLIVAMVLWVLFSIIFSWMILPFALNLINTSISERGSPIFVILGLLLILATTHIAVILLRFTFMRARITSNAN